MPTRFVSRPSALLGAVMALAAVAAPAGAGLLEPGQTGGGEAFRLNLDDPSFDGETLATRTLTRQIEEIDTTTGETIRVTITLTNSVVRESATGRLAFHYSVSGAQNNATVDFENLDVIGFAGFATDVFSNESSLTDARSSRSEDGDTVGFVGDESWGADFVVRTDVTDFDEGGTAVVWASFQTGDFAGSPDKFPSFNTFAPAAGDPGPTPNPIPLPPAAWAALSTMGAFGAFKKLRRRG